jgi:hypothetical protein
MIFVQIASFKDTDVLNTIESMYSNADHPEEIRTVVLNQIDMADYKLYTNDHPKVEFFNIESVKAKGVCWARSILQSMVRGEDYYMQIDAHMRFAKSWDTKMIHYLKIANSQKPILSFYPPGFEGDWKGDYIVKNIIRGVGAGAVSSINEVLDKNKIDIECGVMRPIPSNTTAAGFLFAPIKFVEEIPIDPKLFWNFEETDITLRAYTHGWDFFATPEPLIWHKYNTTGKMIHMDEEGRWVALENESNEHAPKKYFDPLYKYPERYMLGNTRTIKSFEILNNVDIQGRTMTTKEDKKVLIVVPYRDRDEHLKEYLQRVPEYFKDISHDILLCELDPGCEWNAGITVNTSINFLKKSNYEFIYIHHVDVYPVGEWKWPEPGSFISDLGDVGSCLLRVEDFLKVGGYGNNFWGWGGEDDNLYNKLAHIGLTRVKSDTEFDTKYQSHDRPFNGINYTNNLREIYKPFDLTSIFNVNKVSTTRDLHQVSDNIYKQNVKINIPSKKHTKVIVGFIKNIDTFVKIAPWVKSAIYYGTDYDVWIITPDTNLTTELNAFGAHVYQYETKGDYLYIDRFNAFKEFLQENPYEEIFHVDVTDAYFQSNPFEQIDPNDSLVIASEYIKFENCSWNTNTIMGIYGFSYPDKNVLCTGVIYGKKDRFIELCDKILEESNKFVHAGPFHGSDQPIVNKLVYNGEIEISIYDQSKPLAVHLHHHFNTPGYGNVVTVHGLKVINQNQKPFAIVHQFNRDIEMYNKALNNFTNFFTL